jgi:hypothetical protein
VSKWGSSRARVAGAAVAAALVLGVLIGTPVGQAAASRFLAQFRSERVTAVGIDASQVNGSLYRLDKLGTIKDTTSARLRDRQTVASMADASSRVGIPVKQLDAAMLPAGVKTQPTISVSAGGEFRFTFSKAKARQFFSDSGHPEVVLPDKFDGATLVVSIPPTALLVYGTTPAGDGQAPVNAALKSVPGVMVGASGPVAATVEGNVSLEEMRTFLLNLPGLPAATVEQLKGIQDWQTTLPLPVPTDRMRWQNATINGNQGLILTETGRLGSAAIWTNNGNIYGVFVSGTAADAQRLAGGLH